MPRKSFGKRRLERAEREFLQLKYPFTYDLKAVNSRRLQCLICGVLFFADNAWIILGAKVCPKCNSGEATNFGQRIQNFLNQVG